MLFPNKLSKKILLICLLAQSFTMTAKPTDAHPHKKYEKQRSWRAIVYKSGLGILGSLCLWKGFQAADNGLYAIVYPEKIKQHLIKNIPLQQTTVSKKYIQTLNSFKTKELTMHLFVHYFVISTVLFSASGYLLRKLWASIKKEITANETTSVS
ncbi:MAG TPA: hypothetical protein VGT41_00135 [Candidatus Babeliales bacterium]|nr:hypothetical protein [Candidatus Babeliales bacterium]